MKKILFGLILLINLNIYSQQRVNGETVKFEAVGKSLNESVGWEFDNIDNKWIENKKDKFGKNLSSTENFYEFFFTKIKNNGEVYYILNIIYLDGDYKYPSIKKEFFTYNVIRSYVFNEADFLKMKKYESVSTNYYPYITYIDSKTISQNEIEELRINTISALRDKLKSKSEAYEMKIKKEDEKVIRFILPFKINGVYSMPEYWGFDKQYFEVEKIKFDMIFDL
jgi:6-pyruvoyl-tetrahydropterin synthase